MKPLLSFLFIWLATPAVSQSLDTLLYLLETKYVKEDTMRGICLGKLAFAYMNIDSAKSEEYSAQLLDLSKKLNHEVMEAEAYLLKGHVRFSFDNCEGALPFYDRAMAVYEHLQYQRAIAMMYNNYSNIYKCMHDFEKAQVSLERSLAMSVALKDSNQVANCYNNLGNFYFMQEKYGKALEYALKSYEIKDKFAMPGNATQSVNNIGGIYIHIGDYDKAMVYLKEAAQMAESFGLDKLLADVFSNIGMALEQKGDFPEALDYYRKALDIQIKVGNRRGIQLGYSDLGDIVSEQGDYDAALEYYQKSLAICRDLEDDELIGFALNNIGTVYKDQKEYTTAEQYFSEAQTLFESIDSWFGRAVIASNRAEISFEKDEYEAALFGFINTLDFYKKGEREERVPASMVQVGKAYLKLNRPDNAIPYLNEALTLAIARYEKDVQMDAHEQLATALSQKSDFEKALEHHQAFHALYTELYNEENSTRLNRAMAELNAEAQQEKLDKQMAKLELQEARNQNQQIMLLFAGILLLVASGFAWFYLDKTKKLKKQKVQINSLLTNAYHTTKNHLQVLASIIGVQNRRLKNLEARELLRENQARVEAIRNLHQQLLFNESGQASIRLDDYLSSIANNTLRLFRSEDTYRIELSTDVEALKTSHKVATALGLVTNELLTNAFKYAFTPDHPDPCITLSVKAQNGVLHMVVADNGKGLPEELQSGRTSGSFGMELVHLFLDNIGARLNIANGSGTRFEIVAPNWKNT